jgi:hypothetical protein
MQKIEIPRPLSQITTYNRSNVFTFTLPLSEGQASEAWEPSNKIMFCPLPRISLFTYSSSILSYLSVSLIILKGKAKFSLCLTN